MPRTPESGFDLRAEITAICEKLGVEHDHVAQIELWPTKAIVTVLKFNEDGRHYVTADGEAAKEVHTFKVSSS